MSAPAAIQASLVDVRNIAAHKCVRLELHVPVEHAALVMGAFGWPTAADPVPVALARLDLSKPASDAPKQRTAWVDMRPSAQCAIRCGEADFQKFMTKRAIGPLSNMDTVELVRHFTGVLSRAELDIQESAAARWRQLDGDYERERRGAR